MIIFEEIKKSVKQVNSSPLITLFFVSFLILITVFASYTFVLQQKILSIILMLCIFLLLCLFFGGWLEMFSEAQKEEKKSLAGVFFEGAGKSLVSSIITLLIFALLMVLISFAGIELSMKFFGDPSFLMNDIATIAQDKNAYLEYINNLSEDKLVIIYGWQAIFVLLYSVFYFLFLFLPATFIKTEKVNMFLRPIIAYGENFKFIFKNFGFSICLYLILCAGFIFMGILKLIAAIHPILSLIHLFIYIYFLSYVVMLIFNCYERKNSCIDGCNSIGENENCDSTGKSE